MNEELWNRCDLRGGEGPWNHKPMNGLGWKGAPPSPVTDRDTTEPPSLQHIHPANLLALLNDLPQFGSLGTKDTF